MTASPLVTDLINAAKFTVSAMCMPKHAYYDQAGLLKLQAALSALDAAPGEADPGAGLAAVQSLLNDWENEMEGDDSSTDDSLNRLEQCANELREALAAKDEV